MRIFNCLLIIITMAGLAGCMTIYDGTTQRIKIQTRPSEASVLVEEARTKNIIASDTSPMEIDLKRNHSYHIKINKDGYHPTTVGIWRKTNDAIWIDLGLLPFHPPGTGLGLVSALFDHLSGAIWDLEPADINVQLEPVSPLKPEESK